MALWLHGCHYTKKDAEGRCPLSLWNWRLTTVGLAVVSNTSGPNVMVIQQQKLKVGRSGVVVTWLIKRSVKVHLPSEGVCWSSSNPCKVQAGEWSPATSQTLGHGRR